MIDWRQFVKDAYNKYKQNVTLFTKKSHSYSFPEVLADWIEDNHKDNYDAGVRCLDYKNDSQVYYYLIYK